MQFCRLIPHCLCATTTLFSAPQVFAAEGAALIGIGPIQVSQVGAGVADPADASWIERNPAGLAGMQTQVMASSDLLFSTATLDSAGALALPDATKQEDDRVTVIPQMAGVLNRGPHSFGFGIFATHGGSVHHDDPRTTVGAASGNKDRKFDYSVVKLMPSYAMTINEQWSVGLTMHVAYGQFAADLLTSAGVAEADFSNDTAWGIGIAGGLLYRSERWRFGLAVTSPTWYESFDKYDDLLKAPSNNPFTSQVGVAFDVNPRWTTMVDYRYLAWDEQSSSGDHPDTGGFGWDAQHIVKIASRYQINDRLTIRGGLSYGNSVLDDGVVFANAFWPTVNRWHIGAGANWLINTRWRLDTALLYVPSDSITESGENGNISALGTGTSY